MPKAQFKIGIKNSVSGSYNSDGTTLELYFLDCIENTETYDWYTGEEIEISAVDQVVNAVKMYNPSTVKCYIDSLGGDLNIAMAIYNFLKNCKAKVEVEIIGMCMSAATIIAMSASKGKLRMPRNSFFVIHEASSEACGTAEDMRQAAELIDRYTAQVADILAQRNSKGMTAEAVAALWAGGDYWMTGQEAYDMGFVDEVYNSSVSATNRVKEAATIYNNVTEEALMERIKGFEPVTGDDIPEPEHTESIKNVLNDFIMKVKNIAEKFTGAIKNTGAANKGEAIDLHAVLAEPVTNMLNELETEINTEMETLRSDNEALKNDNAALKTKLETLETSVSNLVAEATKGKGSASSVSNSGENVKTFGSGRVKA